MAVKSWFTLAVVPSPSRIGNWTIRSRHIESTNPLMDSADTVGDGNKRGQKKSASKSTGSLGAAEQ
jgi:hypothetical protein